MATMAVKCLREIQGYFTGWDFQNVRDAWEVIVADNRWPLAEVDEEAEENQETALFTDGSSIRWNKEAQEWELGA